MRRNLLFGTLAAASLWASSALPCGGGFGPNMYINRSQTIIVKHAAGVETYIFRPSFCGQSAAFGLVLPIPAELTSNPKLAEPALFDELEAFTAPRVVHETKCGEDPRDGGVVGGGSGPRDGGVDVVNAGRVGIFDWVLLKADTRGSFTQWLDANGFPHAPAADASFEYYVNKGWYFVAFKVTASDTAPPVGIELCGELGPLSLSFPAVKPVIPARIAAVDTFSPNPYAWEVFGISDAVVDAPNRNVLQYLKFAGSFASGQSAAYPELSTLAQPGQKVTKLLVSFSSPSLVGDIELVPSPSQADFREPLYATTWVACDAGAWGNTGEGPHGSGANGGHAGPAAGGVADASHDDSGCAISGGRPSRFSAFATFGALCAGWLAARRRRGSFGS